jgi:phenylalanyl-tRNA synthetase alpha chain
MNAEFEKIKIEALKLLGDTNDHESLEAWYRKFLARSGSITNLKREIGKVEAKLRSEFGKQINELSSILEGRFNERKAIIKQKELASRMMEAGLDVTLPPRLKETGGYHPVSLMLREIYSVFAHMGFLIFESPHVELDEYNFQLLNIPAFHPARDMQDTFFVSSDVLLRTHTSAGQIRAMRTYAPSALRVILPGLCYRYESVTPRSEIQFHQVEGLLVGPTVKMSDLKGILLLFARMIFGESQEIRMRGSYFPFTEPSVEVDIKCTICGGKGCRVCKYSGWLELLGAGLVHPTVLCNGLYDPTKVRGVAFGTGVERIIMLRHGINDIRFFFQNDLRFLKQFV